MKEKILIASLKKIFELCSQELLCPTKSNLDGLLKDELVSLYEKFWSLICDVHNITFETKETIDLFKTLNL